MNRIFTITAILLLCFVSCEKKLHDLDAYPQPVEHHTMQTAPLVDTLAKLEAEFHNSLHGCSIQVARLEIQKIKETSAQKRDAIEARTSLYPIHDNE